MKNFCQRKVLFFLIIGLSPDIGFADDEHVCDFPAALTSEDIKTEEVIEDYGALRLPVPPTGTNDSVDLFRNAIRIVRNRDKCTAEDSVGVRRQKKVLSGYFAIRAIHGLDVYSKSSETLFNMRLATLFTADAMSCKIDRQEGRDCGLWNRCVHSDDGGRLKIQDLDYEHYDAPLFLIWHRAYIRAFEITLRDALRYSSTVFDKSAVEKFGIPYWPWVVIANRSVPAVFRVNGRWCADTYATKVRNLLLGNPPEQDVFLNCGRAETANSGMEVVGLEATPNPFKLIDNDFSSFSNELENSWHAFVHQGIGGDMGTFDSAADDPLFWIHHSFVDFLFDEWIKRNKSKFDDSCSMLRVIWNKKQFKFPVAFKGDVVWYKPSLDELGLCMNQSVTSSKKSYSFDAEMIKRNFGQKADAYTWARNEGKSELDINNNVTVGQFFDDEMHGPNVLTAASEENLCKRREGVYSCIFKFQNPAPVNWSKIDKGGLLLALEISADLSVRLNALRGNLRAPTIVEQFDRVFFSFDNAFILREGREHMPFALHMGLGFEDGLDGRIKICEEVSPRYFGVFTSFGLPYRNPSVDPVSAGLPQSNKVLDVTRPLSAPRLSQLLASSQKSSIGCNGLSEFLRKRKFLLVAIKPVPKATGELAVDSRLKPLGFSSVSIVLSGK